MIKKSVTLLTLTAVSVQGYDFWEHPGRSLKAIQCTGDEDCKSVSKTAICLKQKISTKTEMVCVAQTKCTKDA